LSGEPVVPPSRWAAKSNVEVGQTTYPINRGRVGTDRKRRERGKKVTKRMRGKERVEWGGKALF